MYQGLTVVCSALLTLCLAAGSSGQEGLVPPFTFNAGGFSSGGSSGQDAQVPPFAVNARDFGAVADGKTDDTASVQKALDEAGGAGGGIVWLSAGNYRIAGHLQVPNNVTLQGVWSIPPAFSQLEGTTLLAEEGHGNEEGPAFITLGRNSTVRGLTIYYPNQDKENIVPYPWCIACSGQDNASIVNVLMVNPYKGVDFSTRNSGRHYIRNLYGQPLRIGISVDKCYDVGRIENVHFWPFWAQWHRDAHVREFISEKGEAFIFGRTDWEYVYNTFCFGYKVGYRFTQTEHGACNGNFLGIGADATNVSVQVDQCQGIGLLITNGEFVSMLGDEPTEVVVGPENTGLAQFNNCAFWGPADRIATIRGEGAVSFNQCHFAYWDRGGGGKHAIDCHSGHLTVSSCRFDRSAPGVNLHPDVRTAAIYGNFFAGKQRVTNRSEGDVEIGMNVSTYQPIEIEEGGAACDDLDGPPDFEIEGDWTPVAMDGYKQGRAVWATPASAGEQATARWSAQLPEPGRYEVYVYYGPDPNEDHATNAPYTVRAADGEQTVRVDQTTNTDDWRHLGDFAFGADEPAVVRLSNDANGNVIADAVKFVPCERPGD